MLFLNILFVLNTFEYCVSDWVSDWMSPVEREIKGNPAQRPDYSKLKLFDTEDVHPQLDISPKSFLSDQNIYDMLFKQNNPQETDDGPNLINKLERTLENAKALAEMLQGQILEVSTKENALKEAIANGRYGITAAKVSAINQLPRSFIIRDGVWNLCDGVIQLPAPLTVSSSSNLFADMLAEPKCIGQEITSSKDPCVFNSIIKYETLPTFKKAVYEEDTFLCLKQTFNNTLERYLSVPRSIVNATCRNGVVRSFQNNLEECGVRTLSEYTFFPYRSSAASTLPLEYCSQQDGSCKLMVGWHISDGEVNNFEYLKDETEFKKFFVLSEPHTKHVI